MLKNILSPDACARCRICCVFDKYDVWETPVFSEEKKSAALRENPRLRFVSKGGTGAYIFNMEDNFDSKTELYTCPALDPEKGCTLTEGKPFDCKIWPYRIMSFGGENVIAIASICPELYAKPLSVLCGELDNGLADIIFREAEKNPAIVKPYEQGYPILRAVPHGR